MGSARSTFLDFESYFRIVVVVDEDDIQLISKQYNSYFIAYEIPPAVYSIKDDSEAVYKKGNFEGTIQIENDDISMKTKLFESQFVLTFGTLRFDRKSIFLLLYYVSHHFVLKIPPLIFQMYMLVKKFYS